MYVCMYMCIDRHGLMRPLSFPFHPILTPEIHRAWITVDNVLYIWDYHTEEAYAQIDELEQLIVAVGLVRPNEDVFKDTVKVGR